jgi:hypothetical protein
VERAPFEPPEALFPEPRPGKNPGRRAPAKGGSRDDATDLDDELEAAEEEAAPNLSHSRVSLPEGLAEPSPAMENEMSFGLRRDTAAGVTAGGEVGWGEGTEDGADLGAEPAARGSPAGWGLVAGCGGEGRRGGRGKRGGDIQSGFIK